MHGFANVLLLSGPSGGGKSTFARFLKEGRLPDDLASRLPPLASKWPVVDVTNRMRRRIESEGEAAAAAEFGNPPDLVLHYDITTVYRYGLAGYETDPALRLLRLASDIRIVFVCPDAVRLYQQFVDRDTARKARKSAPARAWNKLALAPLRKLRMRLYGQVANSERALYSDPLWLVRCYDAWEAYMAALVAAGVAQDILRVAPCRAEESAWGFCALPERPVAAARDGLEADAGY